MAYSELVKSLRICANEKDCVGCKEATDLDESGIDKFCVTGDTKMVNEAADANGEETTPKPLSNGDTIRSMSDYDLADWIAQILCYCVNKIPNKPCSRECPLYKCCNDQPSDNIEDWLKSPVEVDE